MDSKIRFKPLGSVSKAVVLLLIRCLLLPLFVGPCFKNATFSVIFLLERKSWFGLGAELRYMGYFSSLLHPQEENLGYYFQSGTCLGALENHVLLSFLWSMFCKWPVINITLLTLKIAVHKIQDQ